MINVRLDHALRVLEALPATASEHEQVAAAEQLRFAIPIAKRWQARFEYSSKASWFIVYALGIKWIPGQFNQCRLIQIVGLSLLALLSWRLHEESLRYEAVAQCASGAVATMQQPSQTTWTSEWKGWL